MLQAVLGQQAQPQAAGAKRSQPHVMDEAYPESEHNLNPGAASTGQHDAGTGRTGQGWTGLPPQASMMQGQVAQAKGEQDCLHKPA